MSLPAHLLDDILLRLEIRDAVRTSALSRAWRRRWESLPDLALSSLDRPVNTPPEVVDGVLVRYPGCVSRFSFRVNKLSAGRVDNWLIALSRRGVKSISLRGQFALHSSIFSCSHLVSPDLLRCRISPLPVEFAGFPVLNELKLQFVQFMKNGGIQLEKIIARSPLLQDLYLCEIQFVYDALDHWVIYAPNLRNKTIISESED